MRSGELLLTLILAAHLGATVVMGQEDTLVFVIDTGVGLIYLLLIVFLTVNFCTPVVNWIYINYLERLVESANKQMSKISKRISDRLSDVGRKASQSVRSTDR